MDEMDRAMIERWNSVVGTGDIVYVLGDINSEPGTLKRIHPPPDASLSDGVLCLFGIDLDANFSSRWINLCYFAYNRYVKQKREIALRRETLAKNMILCYNGA